MASFYVFCFDGNDCYVDDPEYAHNNNVFYDAVVGVYSEEDSEFKKAVNDFRKLFKLEENGSPAITEEEVRKIKEEVNRKYRKIIEDVRKTLDSIKIEEIDHDIVSNLWLLSEKLYPEFGVDRYCIEDGRIDNDLEFVLSLENAETRITKIYHLSI